MKDLGNDKSYIGIDIEYNYRKGDVMTLSQTKYIESLAIKYNIENAKLYKTPTEVNLKLRLAEVLDENVKYRNLIGALLYLSCDTRPDIAFSVKLQRKLQPKLYE